MYLDYIPNLRAVAICAIVLHHTIFAFCGWPPCVQHSVETSPYILHICAFLRIFGLGIFTYISGYLFNLGMTRHPERAFLDFFKGKVYRLLIPLGFFGLLYWILFPKYVGDGYHFPVIEGSPLWYLPMLFIIFMVSFAIQKFNDRKIRILAIATTEVLFYISCKLEIPFSGNLFIYYPCFLFGAYANTIIDIVRRYLSIYLSIYLLILAGILYLQIDPEISSALPNQVKILLEMITVISTATVIFGIFKTKNIRFPKTLKLIGNKSFGIYLIHQFIINTIVTLFFFQGSAWPNILLLFIVVVSISMGMILLLEYKPIAKFSKYIGV